jgi:phosphatidylethanolamine-binding protein (PEBP) family uncharacterized protein
MISVTKKIACNAITIVLSVLLTFLGFSGCTHGHRMFEDIALDVPEIAVSSDSIDAAGGLLIETGADKKPNNSLGRNQSPQLTWEAVDGAAYYAVCMFDESAHWLHWLVLDLEKTELMQGAYTSRSDYIGSYPPANSGRHTYRIEVFALKRATDKVILKLDEKQSYLEIIRYLNRSGNGESNIIARGYVIGTYEN